MQASGAGSPPLEPPSGVESKRTADGGGEAIHWRLLYGAASHRRSTCRLPLRGPADRQLPSPRRCPRVDPAVLLVGACAAAAPSGPWRCRCPELGSCSMSKQTMDTFLSCRLSRLFPDRPIPTQGAALPELSEPCRVDPIRACIFPTHSKTPRY